MTLKDKSVPWNILVDIIKMYLFYFETGRDICRLFHSKAESKHSRCHGNMADVAVSTMQPDFQMGYIIFLKVVGAWIHFFWWCQITATKLCLYN